MQPVANPSAHLFCQNNDCAYTEEAWRFKANGGDDVVYSCPRCNSVANLHPVSKTDNVALNQLIERANEKEIKPVNNQTPKEQILWIVASLDKHFVRVVEEEQVQSLKDFDILLPMLLVNEIDKLPERQKLDFGNNLENLVNAMDEGTLPENTVVVGWLEAIGVSDQAPEPMVEPAYDGEVSEVTPLTQELMFQHGFAQGVSFILGKKYQDFAFHDIIEALDMYYMHRTAPQDDTAMKMQEPSGVMEAPEIIEDAIPEPTKPKVDPAKIQSRVALLQKIRNSRKDK